MKIYTVRILSEPEKLEYLQREKFNWAFLLDFWGQTGTTDIESKAIQSHGSFTDEQYRGLIWIIQI